MVRDYRGSKISWIRGRIARKLGPVTYRVNIGGMMWKRHIDQIRTCDVLCEFDNSEPVKPNPFTGIVPVTTAAETPSEQLDIPSAEPSCEDSMNTPSVDNRSQSSVIDARNSDTNSIVPRYPRRERRKPERLIEMC